MAATMSTMLVAIDVGMTCTGVGFAIKNKGIDMPEPHTIQTWPGNSGGTSDKVPTAIYYGEDGRISWGFLTQQEDDQDQVREWFKVFFDKAEYDKARKNIAHPEELPPSHAEVKRYYEDYLRKLYPHIKKCLIDNVLDWNTAHIEFLFSVPTTWTKLGLTQEFKKLALSAGFGGDGPDHVVDVSLTESEAAAVYTFDTQNAIYSDGDVIMIVDAGGGTTDVALLKVDKPDEDSAALKSLDQVRGDEIGSVEIDMDFADLVERRLLAAGQQHDLSPHTVRKVAEKMSRSRTGFRGYKEEFGTEDSLSRPEYRIEMPGLSDTFTVESANIIRGKMVFSQADIRALFDAQLKKMFKLIDFQMQRMDTVAPHDRITHLVLSGGLGSSQYIKDRLAHRYTIERVDRRAPELRIMSSTRPQLAVVKGLIHDRMRKIKTQKSVLRTRTCRQSLGVLCMQEYNPHKESHKQASLMIDEVDKKTYAKDQIVWFVKQGQQINQDADYIDYNFYRTFRKGKREPWESRIVVCNSRPTDLPNSLLSGEDAVKPLCTMRSDLTALPETDFEKQKKHWWQMKKQYDSHYRACYTIRFQLKPAAVDSQLLFKGQQYSNPNSFDVRWEAGADMAAPKEHREPTQPMAELDRYWEPTNS